MLNRADNFEGTTLHDVYGRYSVAKQNAYNYCRELCNKENGSNFHITSYNTFGFTVAWEVADGIRIETPQNSYKIEN